MASLIIANQGLDSQLANRKYPLPVLLAAFYLRIASSNSAAKPVQLFWNFVGLVSAWPPLDAARAQEKRAQQFVASPNFDLE